MGKSELLVTVIPYHQNMPKSTRPELGKTVYMEEDDNEEDFQQKLQSSSKKVKVEEDTKKEEVREDIRYENHKAHDADSVTYITVCLKLIFKIKFQILL